MTKTKALIIGVCTLLGVGGLIADGYLGFSWGWVAALVATIAISLTFFPTLLEEPIAVSAILALGYLIFTLLAVKYSAIPKGGWHWLLPLGFFALALWCIWCLYRGIKGKKAISK